MMSAASTLAAAFALIAAAAAIASPAALEFDLDGDGGADLVYPPGTDPAALPGDRNQDGLLDLAQPASPPVAGDPLPDREPLPDIDFQLIWDSGTTLSNVLGLGAGDADLDGIFDFAGAHFAPNIVYLFEADGQGSYTEVWNSTGASPPGSYIDFAFADTDGDGLGEIFAAEVSTLGKVMLFEESGPGFTFVHDTIRESDFVGNRRPRRLLIGDTDGDSRQEVIVVCGGSAPTDGLVSIWEHSGAVGENTYTRVFAYTTVTYIFSGALGDSDNDGRPEIVIGYGGGGGFPLYIRRIEYDPNLSTWVHTLFESSVIGLGIGPHVADFDQDGQQELGYGSIGFVALFENSGVNAYTHRFSTAEPMDGTVLTLTSRVLSVPGTRSFAGGSFGGDLGIWSYDPDLDTWDQTYSSPDIGGPIRGLALADDGDDGLEELLTAVDLAAQVRVYRRSAASGIDEPSAASSPPAIRLAAAPNPLSRETRLTAGIGSNVLSAAVLTIHDASGRAVRKLALEDGTAVWDARDALGRPVSPGVYWLRIDGSGPGVRAADALPLVVIP
jgi:hypothetical protein